MLIFKFKVVKYYQRCVKNDIKDNMVRLYKYMLAFNNAWY